MQLLPSLMLRLADKPGSVCGGRERREGKMPART